MEVLAPPTSAPTKPSFDQSYAEIDRVVSSRRHSWTYLSLMEWQDVKQDLVIHIHAKWDTYDPSKTSKQNPAKALEKWVNTIVTRQLHNLRRNLLLRWSRPCIGGGDSNGVPCTHNKGGDSCTAPWVKSGIQCAQCPLFAEWEKTRKHQLHIKSNVALEHHAQEVNNMPGDFIDIAEIQAKLHEEMLSQLTRWEALQYRALFIHHLTPAQVAKRLEQAAANRKGPLRADELTSYASVLATKRRFTDMLLLALKRHGHVDPSYVLRADRADK